MADPDHNAMDTPHDLSALRYRNILIVDDEPTMHLMFETCLRPDTSDEEVSTNANGDVMIDSKRAIYNFNVHSALSGEDSISVAKTQANYNAPIQLAFVDMRMSGWDGIETIQNLMDFDHRMSFVIITGFPEDTRNQVEERLGAAPLQIFPKPTKLDELYQTAYQMTSRWNRLHADF